MAGSQRTTRAPHGSEGNPCRNRACPCHSTLIETMRGRLDAAHGATVDRLLDDTQCREIWTQVEAHDAWQLIAATLAGWSNRPSLGCQYTADRYAGWSLNAANAASLRVFVAKHRGDLEFYLAANAAKGRPRSKDAKRRTVTPQWLAELADLESALQEAPPFLEGAATIFDPPVPRSQKWRHHAADTRHLVLKLAKALKAGHGLGIRSHRRHDVVAKLTSSALGLETPLDRVSVQTILDTARKAVRKKTGV